MTALQSDRVGRIILSPGQLSVKRLRSYQHQWSQSIQLQKLKLRYYWNGGLGKGEDPTTSILTTDEELDDLVRSIVSDNANNSLSAMYTVGTIAKDEHNKDGQEYFLWLFNAQEKKVVQVPAVAFGTKLAEAFENHIFSCTLCFVHDATAGIGSQFIARLMKECFCDTVAIVAGGLTRAWMFQWALLKEQGLHSNAKLHRLLYALCRLETMQFSRSISSVVMVSPTSMVPILLPALHETFPDDRHVFCYTGCVQVVKYAEANRRIFQKLQIPTNLEDATSFGEDPVQFSTPVNADVQSSVHIMPPYSQALADLPVDTAGIVDTWIAAVDTFLKCKKEQRAADFLPYVCRLDYILQEGPIEKNKSSRYWSLRSLVQYMRGSASRELSDQIQDAIVSWLTDYKIPEDANALRHPFEKQIENCVFQHKLILLANKILQDTVAPRQHWTLKQAMKRGCACCIPEDDPDGEAFFSRRNKSLVELDNRDAAYMDGVAEPTRPRGYMDGKLAFAFDPTRFH